MSYFKILYHILIYSVNDEVMLNPQTTKWTRMGSWFWMWYAVMEFIGKTKENHKRLSLHSLSVSQDSDLGSKNVVVKW